MATGIKDKVAILGMGCSKFGERWDASPEDLMVEAYTEALKDAGISPEQIDAAWFSTHMDDVGTGRGGTPMAIALRLPNIGVTRVENFCAGGTEAVRAAVYAVAAGACDIALALGVEKRPRMLPGQHTKGIWRYLAKIIPLCGRSNVAGMLKDQLFARPQLITGG